MIRQLQSNANDINTNGLQRAYSGKPVSETLTNGYFVVDQEWTVKYWNKAAEKILGVTEKEILGKNLWEQFVGIIPVEFYAVYHKAFIEDVPIYFQEYWAQRNAWFEVTTLYCEKNLCVSFKSSGTVSLENVDNIRERLNTLAYLYKFITEITNDCLWEWDLKTDEIFWIDGGHKRVFGYPIENTLLPAVFWKKCIHPEDRSRVLTKLKKLIDSGSDCIWEDEYRFKKLDGSYLYVQERGRIVKDEDEVAVRIIGATQDINKRIFLEKELEYQEKEQLHEVTGAIISALEAERTKIGMELHDNLGQLIAVSKMYMQMAQKSDNKQTENIDKAISHINEVMNEIRKIAKNLIIPPAHIISLSQNIRILIQDIKAVHPLEVEFSETGVNRHEHSELLEVDIFRIIQEQLNNILKHSQALNAKIHLNWQQKEVILIISDNGKGQDVENEKKGVGIINIRSRVKLRHGKIIIKTEAGKGYSIKAIIPLDKVA